MRAITTRRQDSRHGRWEYAYQTPQPLLQPHVLRLRGQLQEAWHFSYDRGLPSPAVSLVFAFGQPIQVLDDTAQQVVGTLTSPYVIGASERSTLTRRSGGWGGVIVELTPIGARRLLGAPAAEIANRIVPLDDLVGPPAARLQSQLAEAASWADRFALVEAFLTSRMDRDGRGPCEMSAAWQVLAARGGDVRISELKRLLRISHKKLAADFRREFGLAPKRLARLLRLDRAFHLLSRPADLPATFIAAECGFYDQAHLINEMTRHAGLSPEFLRRAVRAGWRESDLPLGPVASVGRG